MENEMIVRDYLAMQRTGLANERTLLSYIRTSLYFLVSGTALLTVEDLENIKGFGFLFFALSLICIVFGILNFLKIRKRLRRDYYSK